MSSHLVRVGVAAALLAWLSTCAINGYRSNLVISVPDPTPCWSVNELAREIVQHREDIMAEYDNRDPVDDRFPDDEPYDPPYWLCTDDGRFQ